MRIIAAQYEVAVDADGNIAIAEGDGRGHRLIKLNASGVPQFTIGEAGIAANYEAHHANAKRLEMVEGKVDRVLGSAR